MHPRKRRAHLIDAPCRVEHTILEVVVGQVDLCGIAIERHGVVGAGQRAEQMKQEWERWTIWLN